MNTSNRYGIELVDVSQQGTASSRPKTTAKPPKSKRGLQFWLILLSLCLSLFLSALEFTAVSTALPLITADLHGNAFVWVGAAYALASSAILPMTAGAAQAFGRRIPMAMAIFLFALGSTIGGAAQSMAMLIGGRTVQGMGSGGILSFSAIILADLVPLRERGIFAALFGLTWSLAAAIGPVVGGSLSNRGQWRWIFFLNLPICAVAGFLILLLVKLPTPPGTLRSKLAKMDWIGNFIVIGATAAVTISLTDGGVIESWPSAKVLTSLIIGAVGLIGFLVYEAKFSRYPLVPINLLTNRTSASGYAQAFLLPVTTLAAIYYLPVYFQACKGADANRSGVLLLSMGSVAVGAMVGGRSIALLQRYRPQIWVGWVLQTIGMALLTIVKLDTNVGVAVGFIIIYGTGAGINYALQVYPVQAPLPIASNAHPLAFFSFMRSFAGVWGVTLGGVILQNELHHRLPSSFLAQFPSGVAVVYSAIPGISALDEPLKTQVREAFVDSLRIIWAVIAGTCGVGLMTTLFMKHYALPEKTDSQWGLKEERDERSPSNSQHDETVQLLALHSQFASVPEETESLSTPVAIRMSM